MSVWWPFWVIGLIIQNHLFFRATFIANILDSMSTKLPILDKGSPPKVGGHN